VGKYHAGATDADRRTLMRAVVEIGRQAGGIVPTGMDIELLDA
jgi:phage gp29-like protein